MTINYTMSNFNTTALDFTHCKSLKTVAYFFWSSSNDRDINYLLSAGRVYCRWKYENVLSHKSAHQIGAAQGKIQKKISVGSRAKQITPYKIVSVQ